MTDVRTISTPHEQAVAPTTATTVLRAPYQRPALERLGAWSARTLQMTIIIEPA